MMSSKERSLIAGLGALVLVFLATLLTTSESTDTPGIVSNQGSQGIPPFEAREIPSTPYANTPPNLDQRSLETDDDVSATESSPEIPPTNTGIEPTSTVNEVEPTTKAGASETNAPQPSYRDRFPAGKIKQGHGATPPGLSKLDPKKMPKQPKEQDILQPGLLASYFVLDASPSQIIAKGDDPFGGEPVLERVDPMINFPKRESFNIASYKGNVAAQWEGLLHVDQEQTISFVLGLDSSGALVIDDQLVIFNRINFHYNELHARVQLAKGYHNIRVEHLDNADGNELSAARLMYIPQGQSKAEPLPADWFFLPLNLSSSAPRIDRIRPRAAEIGQDVTICGSRFLSTEPFEATIEQSSYSTTAKAFAVHADLDSGDMPKRGETLEIIRSNGSFVCPFRVTEISDQRRFCGEAIGIEKNVIARGYKIRPLQPQVRVDGLKAKLKRASKDELVITLPVGAADGIVRVTQGIFPSNEERVKITTPFGLIVSVWDMTGYPLTSVNPRVRPADHVSVIEDPFPLKRSMFPDFAGKSIAVKVEGRLASLENILYAFETKHARGQLKIRGIEHEFSDEVPIQGIHLLKSLSQAAPFSHTLEEGDTVFSIAQHYYDTPRFFRRILRSNPDWDPSLIQKGQTILLPPSERPHSLIYNATINTERRWTPFVLDVLFEPSESIASVSMGPVNSNTARRGDFKPAYKLPPQPRLINFYGEYDGLSSAAPVGGEACVWLSLPADSDATPRFIVDGKNAKARKLDRRLPGAPHSRPFWLYAVKIPQGAGRGEVRARNGIVQSNKAEITVTNRGLIGYYYDLTQPLDTIPDMTSLLPDMTRTDKQIDFTSNVDFQLPFPAERFAAEWYGSLHADLAGNYTFIVRSDDGFRITLNGTMAFEHNGLRSTSESQVSIELSQGWHDIHVEYFENDWVENITLWWIKPGATAREVVPTSHLSTTYSSGIPEK